MRIKSPLTTAFAFYSSTSKLTGRSGSITNPFPSANAEEIVSPVSRKTVSPSSLQIGVGKAAADFVLKDFTGEAMGWFGGVRIPASLIVGKIIFLSTFVINSTRFLHSD